MIKSTGMVRKLDELGRIVLPKELRTTLNIDNKDALEVFVDEENIILRKYMPGCIFCGNAGETTPFKGKNICKSCLEELQA